jgi:hypothetical protein
VFFLLFSSSFLLLCPVFSVDCPKISLGTNLSDLKNYVMTYDLISNDFVSPFDTKTEIGDSLLEINSSNTFFAKGLLSSVLFPYYNMSEHDISKPSNPFNFDNPKNEINTNTSLYEFPKLISGNWILNVSKGTVTNFHGAFKLLNSDGLEKHYVELINLQSKNMPIILNPYTNTTIIGSVDIMIDGQLFDSDLPVKIKLTKINTIEISFDKQSISDLFLNNPIYGIVESFKNFKNDELLILDVKQYS